MAKDKSPACTTPRRHNAVYWRPGTEDVDDRQEQHEKLLVVGRHGAFGKMNVNGSNRPARPPPPDMGKRGRRTGGCPRRALLADDLNRKRQKMYAPRTPTADLAAEQSSRLPSSNDDNRSGPPIGRLKQHLLRGGMSMRVIALPTNSNLRRNQLRCGRCRGAFTCPIDEDLHTLSFE